MSFKLPKAARGFEYGDVSNQALRNILTGVSRKIYGKVTQQDMQDAFDFFEGKCPYTGKDLRSAVMNHTGEYAIDHIVPQNKECCGLNVMGNLIFVDKIANSKKNNQTVEDFLLNDQTVLAGTPMSVRKARLDKIKEFQKKYKYDPVAIQKLLSPYLSNLYDEIRVEQEKRIDEAVKLTGLPPLVPFTNISKSSKGNKVPSQDVPVYLTPSNPETFKQEILNSKLAKITLIYDSGAIKTSVWKANSFDSSSSVMGNIKSRPFWRSRKSDGLIEVRIEVIYN